MENMSSSREPMESTEKLITTRKKGWSLKRKLFVSGGAALAIIIVLAVGLGVGLTRRHSSNDDDTSDNTDDSSSSNNNTSVNSDWLSNTTDPDTGVSMWKPTVGLTWQYVLKWPLNSTLINNTQVWDIDVFDNPRTTIVGLQQNKAKVICYFSAGSYENWRPDKDSFKTTDLGAELNGWPGERWLNVSSTNVRKVMLSRLDLAVKKGCNGVDPDNVDGYDNDNGLGLSKAQAIDYVKWLANAAHIRGLSIGLKNAGGIIPDVLSHVDFSVNEQCVQ